MAAAASLRLALLFLLVLTLPAHAQFGSDDELSRDLEMTARTLQSSQQPGSLSLALGSDESAAATVATRPAPPASPRSNTAAVLMFHFIPYFFRAAYQTYLDLREMHKARLFGRDYTKKQDKTKLPLRDSRTAILPKETYEGYDADYYSRLQDTKPVPLWWHYDGKTPPPWFTNNAPPNRPHFMRSPVPVPRPPFKSPFNKHMFSRAYWQQKPPPWPLLHHPMVPGQQPGEGSMKCPCPHQPMMMCDCNSVQYQEEAELQEKIEARERSAKQLVTSADDPYGKLERDVIANLFGRPEMEALLALAYKRQGS